MFNQIWTSYLSSFRVACRLGHDRLLSPVLYNVYSDEVNKRLKQSKLGCHFAGVCVNHIIYADENGLQVPSAKTQHLMLNVCTDFVTLNSSIYISS